MPPSRDQQSIVKNKIPTMNYMLMIAIKASNIDKNGSIDDDNNCNDNMERIAILTLKIAKK